MGHKKSVDVFRTTFYWIVRVIGLALIVSTIINIIINGSEETYGRYVSIIAQALCLIILSFVPVFINKMWKISIPIGMEIFFLAYCSCGLLLGEIAQFFIKFSWYDSVLHTISGSFIACVGFVIISLFNEKDDVPLKVSPAFLILFVFCLSLACGLVWEIFEWTVDGIFGSNMQRFSDNYTREDFLGRMALKDTMKDLILDTLGAGIICALAYIDMKTNKNYIKKYFRVKRIESESSAKEVIIESHVK